MSTTIGILAHVDAGKTTLAEQLLCRSGLLRAAGRVDRQNAFLDSEMLERRRGITIFSGQAPFCWKERNFHLLDTPGHTDFSGEMERALWAMDCAILVVSAIEGIQSHTGTVWQLLREAGIPVFIFLNKLDRIGANPERVRAEMAERWEATLIPWQGAFPEALQEELAALDEGLMEKYFAGEIDEAGWREAAAALFRARKFLPVLTGTALAGEGTEALLDALAALAPDAPGSPDAPFSGRVYKVLHDKQGGRVTCVKVTSGRLRAKGLIQMPGSSPDGSPLFEKAAELRGLSGGRFSPLGEALPGDLAAVTGLSFPRPGDIIGEGAERLPRFSMKPLLSVRVQPPDGVPLQTVLGWFKELEDEEPLLSVRWEETLRELSVQVMGRMQLDVLQELVRQRFGAEVAFGRCQVLYQETLEAPVHGCGHYEPLRHYAEVHLLLSPAPRGSGITFDSICPTDDLAASWQNLIRTHVLEKEHIGVLTGMPATDLQVTLLAGRNHLKHTEGGDFREATYRAVRQGLMAGKSLLLEPWYAFEIDLPLALSGRVLGDVQRMKGEAEPPVLTGDRAIIKGKAPASEMLDYPEGLTSLSRGQARVSLRPAGYFPCHNPDEVIAQCGYLPERDLANPCGSVFCAHGAGYPVSWQDAPAAMHIQLKKIPGLG